MTESSIPKDALVDWHNKAAEAVEIDQQVFQGAFMRDGEVIDPSDPEGVALSAAIEAKAELLDSFRSFVIGYGAEIELITDEDDIPEA